MRMSTFAQKHLYLIQFSSDSDHSSLACVVLIGTRSYADMKASATDIGYQLYSKRNHF